MNITDEMVERVADAIMQAQDRGRFDDLPPEDRHYLGWGAREDWRRVAREALTAALGDVEPLESVLPVGIAIHLFPIHNEDNTLHEIEWEITVTGEGYGFSGSSQTIAEIVQAAAAVANAKGTA